MPLLTADQLVTKLSPLGRHDRKGAAWATPDASLASLIARVCPSLVAHDDIFEGCVEVGVLRAVLVPVVVPDRAFAALDLVQYGPAVEELLAMLELVLDFADRQKSHHCASVDELAILVLTCTTAGLASGEFKPENFILTGAAAMQLSSLSVESDGTLPDELTSAAAHARSITYGHVLAMGERLSGQVWRALELAMGPRDRIDIGVASAEKVMADLAKAAGMTAREIREMETEERVSEALAELASRLPPVEMQRIGMSWFQRRREFVDLTTRTRDDPVKLNAKNIEVAVLHFDPIAALLAGLRST